MDDIWNDNLSGDESEDDLHFREDEDEDDDFGYGQYLDPHNEDWCRLPLPIQHVPVGGSPLANCPDEFLMNCSPSLIAHIQLTAANGGIQVLDPNLAAGVELLTRVTPAKRSEDLLIVGSVCADNVEWPTFDGRKTSHYFCGEPFMPTGVEPAIKTSLKTTPLLKLSESNKNPLVRAMMTAAALVDLQTKGEVLGDAEKLRDVYTKIWGLPADFLEYLAGFNISPDGDLLRYALGGSPKMPTCLMPVNYRRVVSVAQGGVTRDAYGTHVSLNWTRMRAVAEATFYMAMRTEGHSFQAAGHAKAPGDPSAAIDSPGRIIFQPRPGTLFAYPPKSFRIVIGEVPVFKSVKFPDEMVREVRRKVETMVTDITADFNTGRTQIAETSRVVSQVEGEGTLKSVNTHVVHSVLTGQSRGKNATKLCRGYVFKCFQIELSGTAAGNADTTLATLFIGMLSDSKEMLHRLTHEGKTVLCRKIASAFKPLFGKIRGPLSAEANLHGFTLDEWWTKVAGTIPDEIRPKAEGTAGWAIFVAWSMIVRADYKWENLAKMATTARVKVAMSTHIKTTWVQAKYDDRARVIEFTISKVTSIKEAFSNYYIATSKAAFALVASLTASEISRGTKLPEKNIMLYSAWAWEMRGRAFGDIIVSADLPTERMGAVITEVRHMGYVFYIIFSATRCVTSFYGNVSRAPFITTQFRDAYNTRTTEQSFNAYTKTSLRPFNTIARHVCPKRLTKYYNRPSAMGEDFYSGVDNLVADIKQAIDLTLEVIEKQEEAVHHVVMPEMPGTVMEDDAQGARYAATFANMLSRKGALQGYSIAAQNGEFYMQVEEDFDEEAATQLLSAFYDSEDAFYEAYEEALKLLEPEVDAVANTLRF